MKILHLVRQMGDGRAASTAERQRQLGHEVYLLLLHDAVLDCPAFDGTVFACEADVRARCAPHEHVAVTYDEIARLIFEHDRVVSW